ncbi:HYR-like domain-containing protein, partial [Snuella sedimenti]
VVNDAPATFPIGTTTVTWTVTDEEGNFETCTQDVTVTDDEDPSISCPGDLTAICNISEQPVYSTYAEFTNAGGSITDNCTINEASFTLTSEVSDNLSCPETVTRTYQIADMTGNTVTCTQLIVINDEVPPTIDNTNTANIEIECGEGDTQAALNNWLNSNAGATSTDNCGDVTWTNDYGLDTNVKCDNGAITVTFTATDACNNKSTTTATYLIKDTEAPEITTVAADQTVQCDGSGNLTEFENWLNTNAGAEATDDCSSIVWSNNYGEDGNVMSDECGMTGKVLVKFTATDACGNSSSTTALFTIIDTIAPIFTVPEDVTINCDDDATVLTLTGDVIDEADACDTNIGEATYTDEIAAGECANESIITRTWSLTDACDNTTTHVQIITVQDVTPPTFTVPADVTINCDDDATDLVLTGDVSDEMDNCSSELEATYTDEVAAGECANESTITRTWSLTDDCNNTTTHVQTITVQDVTPPTFTVPADVTINCDDDATDLVLTGDVSDEMDNCSSELEATYTDEVAAGECANESTITRTWSLTDDCNNTTTHVQTITVQDITKPEFTAPADVTINCEDDATDLTLTGDVTDESDNCSSGLDATYTDAVAAGNCANESVITRTWSLTDDCNNTTTHVQTITVQDITKPE